MVPRLTQLKSLYWNLDFLPRDPTYLQLFQTHCPGLERLEHIFSFAEIPLSETDLYIRVFDFTNLSYIKLILPGILFTLTDSRMDYVSHMTRLLTLCPNLISLQLENATLDPISAKNIVASLGNNTVFPLLRVFKICGGGEESAADADNADWDGFFALPGCYSHPLRLFFSCHQKIEDLALGSLSSCVYEGKIDPDEMSRLFPSLKHLEGPAFLCNAIIKSNVGQKIESLVVNDVWAGKKDWIADMVIGLREMPKLLRLQLYSEDPEDVIDPLVLDNLLRATPLLERFDCRLGVNNFPAVVLAISHAHNLRHLIVEGEAWIAAALSREHKLDSNYEDWVFTISIVAKHCRRLVIFESS
ncbi:unnamed protein product [Rhizoctonia solani]|uniref:Uncharacterized protein n=1 Tax=Rhizoctonia solani TaxID=456999 RepID=A0A8H3CFG2_9AGAM|nr:unnamed protein product [Rhizoctonia solani]